MSLPIYQRVAVTDAGDVIPGAEYTVINENTGVAAPIYSDRTGATLLSAPYFADSVGTIQFFIAQGTTFRVAASGGVGTYTDRYVYGVAEAVLVQANGNAAINILSDGLPATTGTLQTYGALRLSSDTTAAAVDFGLNGANPWMQSCDKSNLGQSYNLLLNPNGGNVGIGTSSPAKKVEIAGNNQALASNTTLRFTDTDTATQTNQHFGKIEFNSLDASAVSPNRAYITAASENSLAGSYISFGTSAFTAAVSEKLRIDGSGNLLVGKTALNTNAAGLQLESDGYLSACRTGGNVLLVNRKSSNGAMATFQKDGTTVGNVFVTGSNMGIGSSDTGLLFANTVNAILPFNANTFLERDNAIDLGRPTIGRFNDAYVTNGVTSGSDRTQKQDILEITTAEYNVAKACKGLLRSFRWIDAVEKKGDDARIHFGIMAQDLQDAFTAEGLDAGKYGMFMSNTWWETETEVAAVEAVDEVTDEDGNVTTEAVEAKDAYTRTDTFETLAEAPADATERTRLGVRYTELLAFIIAAL